MVDWHRWRWVGGCVAALVALPWCAAGDWPHYRGPGYDGVAAQAVTRASGYPRLWQAEVQTGFSGMTVVDGKVYTMGNAGGQDTVFCLSLATGEVLWRHSYKCDLDPKMYEGGPNATPTVADGRVYTLSKEGHLRCLQASDGALVWELHAKTFGAQPPSWGFAGSATVIGGTAFYNVGANGLALDAATGAVRWSSKGKECGYASPIPLPGEPASLALFAAEHVKGVAQADGRVLWSLPWKTSYDVNAASPLLLGDKLFVTSGYNHGCMLVDLAAAPPRQVWENRAMRSQLNTPVQAGGYLYGIDGDANRRARLVCLEAATGKELWANKELAHGSLVLSDGKLFVLTERGELVVAEATPTAYRELGRQKLLEGRCWTVPTLAAGRLLARNATGQLGCWDLTAK